MSVEVAEPRASAAVSRPNTRAVRPLWVAPGRHEVSAESLPDELPPPGPAALLLVRGLLEVLSGWRPATQLAHHTSARLAADLMERAPRRPRSRPPALAGIRVSQPSSGVAEVTALLRRGPRTSAMALRLEYLRERWLLTRLEVG
jgi:hypothetical protein